MRRAGDFLYDIERTYADKNILIISHNSPLRMFGALNDGLSLAGTAFDHDEDGKRYGNAEVRELPFIPMPHNDKYELDYHRPYIDEIDLIDEDGTTLERVPDVFDCWFESGSMPYAQQHYPFENLDRFDPEKGIGYPANFIAEGLDQTRGWFYSLIVLGTALFDKAPYQNVIVNGLVLAEDGKKMSKSLQNYPDPMELANRVGVDAIRFYLLSSPIMRGEDLNFSEKEALELQRKNIGRLHNVLAMYQTYADDTVMPNAQSTHVLDMWILARLNELIHECTTGFEKYELDRATRPITDFIDDLSVWYLRRSRDRLKGDDAADLRATLGTLNHVLKTLALVMAPSMPFYAEYIWSQVAGNDDVESVHLADWPHGGDVNETDIQHMQTVRDVVTQALEVRARANIKVRQPLALLTINTESLRDAPELLSLIKDELNVKEVVVDASLSEGVLLDTTITPELKREGDAREFIRQVQALRKEMGLKQQDVVTLTIQTDEAGKDVISSHESMITSVTGSSSITFSHTEGKEIVAGDHSFIVAIHNV
jgi:isoleucyl-tRNA synthetase